MLTKSVCVTLQGVEWFISVKFLQGKQFNKLNLLTEYYEAKPICPFI